MQANLNKQDFLTALAAMGKLPELETTFRAYREGWISSYRELS